MLTGLDQLSSAPPSGLIRRLRDSRVGVLTHAAAIDQKGRQTLEVLEELGVSPKVVFCPEHGFDGVAQAEEAVSTQETSGMKMVSLYGDSKDSLSPSEEVLSDLDLIVVDLCDVGSRYYTYVWTALLTTRAALKRNVHTVILDRDNPIGGNPKSQEGKPQSGQYLSLVGLEPIPIRHCLTMAEIVAHFIAGDGGPLGPEGVLSVIPTAGWERCNTALSWTRPFVPPSPNMPTLETALVYPGACLVEGTNLSEGRGTTCPFRLVGAPFLDGERLVQAMRQQSTLGALLRPVSFKPSFGKHAGEICHGVMLHVTEPQLFRPVATYAALVTLAREQAGEQFEFLTRGYEFETDRLAFDLLCGDSTVREAMQAGAPPQEVADALCPVDPSWQEQVYQAEARLEAARVK